ncbi:MAG TPA: hypothetical protein VGN63_21575 [Flavisolibacter sp.]|jgi:hypothetical protein|nr:hypothetical protein [Flavisolibacter sp.]
MAEVLPFSDKSLFNYKAKVKCRNTEYHAFANALDVVGNAMKRPFLILLATIGTLTTYACRCVLGETFTQEVAQSDQIFVGTVLKKTTAEKAYYLFSISQMFKGDSVDTLSIKTGFGGPDCGMVFEVGKTYLVYAHNKQTTWCERNALANNNTDIIKLKYLFDSSFSHDIGKTTNSALTDHEAEYFNTELLSLRKDFDFHGKKVAFVLNKSVIDKEQYFKNWGGKEVVNHLIILTNEERQKADGYDAIIVSWRKQGVSNGFRKRLIKRLT